MQRSDQELTAARDGSAGPGDPAPRRACDQCRLRKIRCDKTWPCSNCGVAKRSCTSTGAGQRSKEPRQRVLISSQYERKIDRIEARLENIEGYLRTIAEGHDQASNQGLRPATTTPGASIPTTASSGDVESSDDESVLGGDSALTAQTAFASEFLEHAVKRTSLRELHPSMKAALANLSQLVEMQKQKSVSHGPRFPLQARIPPGGLTKLPMPPIGVVLPLLHDMKDVPLNLFTIVCATTGLFDFESLCRSLYFPSEEVSQCLFITVNSCLFTLFSEQCSLALQEDIRDEYRSYAHMTQVNVETGLANLPLFLSAKVETVQALLLGAQYSVDVARPSVAWYLNSTAAQLCQTAGFHRAERLTADEPTVTKTKTALFWQAYTLDKNLSLRLGRSSVIQECDISIERSFSSPNFGSFEGWASIPELWVQTAMLQGRIYEQLYSPAALQCPPAELGRRARDLAVECQRVQPRIDSIRDETVAYLKEHKSSEIIKLYVMGDEIQFHVTMTLVYRALPAPEGSHSRFCNECLESARKAMVLHKESIGLMNYGTFIKTIYVHWNLMLVPFAPFFILFCYTVETQSSGDLVILQDFVASLETLRDASETAEKLYRMFRVMLDVASMYLDAKSQQQQDQNMIPVGDEFEMYLGQLGFISTDDHTINQANVPAGAQAFGQESMADWFSGSQNIFGLLEEDLSQIDRDQWMQPGPM